MTASFRPRSNEDSDHLALMALVELHLGRYPELRWLHHSPNGGKRNPREAAKFKRMGVRAGFPDLVLPVRRGDYVGIAIELKVGDNKTSKAQDGWIDHLKREGWSVHVCYGYEAAWARLREYLNTPRQEAL